MAVGFPVGWQVTVGGVPAVGAKFKFFRGDTSTPLTCYSDVGLTVPAGVTVTVNAGGWPETAMFINPALNYDIKVMSADDAEQYGPTLKFREGVFVGDSTGASNRYTVVDTLAELQALEGDDSEDTVLMLGRTSAEDGGQGLFRWLTGDQSANVTADSVSGVYVAPASDATGASGCWKRVFDGKTFDTRWFGVKSDNSTNDNAAFLVALALAAGKTLVVPAGTTLITLADDDAIWYTTTAANTTIRGQGKDATILKVRAVSDSTAYHTFIEQDHANLVLEDLQILLVHDNTIANNGDGTVSGGWIVIDQDADRPVLRRVRVDGGIAEQGSIGTDRAPTFNVFVFDQQANTNLIGQLTEQCEFIRCSRVMLKSNASTGTVTGARSIDDTFDVFYSNAWEVNAPAAAYYDSAIVRPRFYDHKSPDLERYGFWIALAGAQGCVVDAPQFLGACQIAIHIEENSQNISILNPTTGPNAEMQKFLEVIENDVGGSTVVPTGITVINPQIVTAAYTGTGNTLGGSVDIGIECQADGDASTRPFENFQIIGGVIEGFEYAIYDNVNGGGSSLVVRDTILKGTDTNYRCNTPSPFVKPIHRAGATQHIYAVRGGFCIGHQFLEAAPILTAPSGYALGLRDWTVTYRDVTVGNSVSTYFDFVNLDSTSVLEGTVECYVGLTAGSGYGYERRPLTWDGSTSTATAGSIFASGTSTEGGSLTTAIAHPSGTSADTRASAFALRAFATGAAGQRCAATISVAGVFVNEF